MVWIYILFTIHFELILGLLKNWKGVQRIPIHTSPSFLVFIFHITMVALSNISTILITKLQLLLGFHQFFQKCLLSVPVLNPGHSITISDPVLGDPVFSNWRRFLSLSSSFLTVTLPKSMLVRHFVACLPVCIFWCFHGIRLGLWVWGKNTTEEKSCPHCIVSEGTWYQHELTTNGLGYILI